MKRTEKYSKPTAKFLSAGYDDYIASRVLLNAGLLAQGAVLASTAIEKHLKALLAFGGNVSHGHLKTAHINAARAFDPHLANDLNEPFLRLLQRAYKTRYTDTLEVGFNLVIAYREFLAELDYTVHRLYTPLTFSQGELKLKQDYHTHRDEKDVRLMQNNYILNGDNKEQFVEDQPQLVYEIRRCKVRGLLEAQYVTSPSKSDGNFLRSGYTPLDEEGKQYKFAFIPLPNEHAVSVNTFRASYKPDGN